MRVKIEVLRDDGDMADNVSVETQHKRNETFTIHRAENIVVGGTHMFTIPRGGRLVMNSPLAIESPVYDRDQAASVYPSQQRQAGEGADRPIPSEIIKAKEKELAQLKEQEAARQERERLEAEQQAKNEELAKTNAAQLEANRLQAAKTGQQTPAPTTTLPPTTPRTPPQGGQPLQGKTAGSTTADASKAPNPSPGTQTPNPATTQSRG